MPTLPPVRTSLFVAALLAIFAAALSTPRGAVAADYPPGLYAEMNTSKGLIVLSLEYERTPLTVANFVGLAEGTKDSNVGAGKPYYDGLTFHRVIPDFMIQGGDPQGSGRGGPGYRFPDEIDPELKHDGPGILSMANSGPGTNGSQFFITHKETPWLDGKHTVFGRVIKGQDVVDAIEQGDSIETLKVVRVGDAASAFKSDQAAFDALLASSEQRGQQKREAARAKMDAEIEKQFPGSTRTASGLRYIVNEPGDGGAKPSPGTEVAVHYSGRLLDGTEFDNSYKRGEPIRIPIGKGRVIQGWDEAIQDMTKGEKRTLIIPPELGYGARGYPGVIPPNATLIFETELVEF